ncbi:MAG TPA: DUF1330 domain-containing protein [Jatrophihabitantaceae bacterium]|nr:DUF1330 domain-containing protein [Jatrophihabitantaceae bacterium]
MFIDPTPEQIGAFAAEAGNPDPVFMLNLLRFADRANAELAGADMSGFEAYGRYAAEVAPHLERVGGEIVWAGSCAGPVIGPAGEWDVAIVVRYPSRAAFLEMVGDADYLQTSRLRTAALADSRLIPCAGVAVN